MTTATAPMTVEDARQYLVVPNGSRYDHGSPFAGDEGYGSMDTAREHGWTPRASWGRDGWDLGAWPYVVYFFRDRPASGFTVSSTEALGSMAASDHVGYELAEYVEGDVKVWRFPTDELRSSYVDRCAFWYWRQNDEPWVKDHDIDSPPDHLRGPFSWARCDEAAS